MQISPQATSATAQTITPEQATLAFADWETDYRANPDDFYTPAESAAMEVATISEARTIHFFALLRQRTDQKAITVPS